MAASDTPCPFAARCDVPPMCSTTQSGSLLNASSSWLMPADSNASLVKAAPLTSALEPKMDCMSLLLVSISPGSNPTKTCSTRRTCAPKGSPGASFLTAVSALLMTCRCSASAALLSHWPFGDWAACVQDLAANTRRHLSAMSTESNRPARTCPSISSSVAAGSPGKSNTSFPASSASVWGVEVWVKDVKPFMVMASVNTKPPKPSSSRKIP